VGERQIPLSIGEASYRRLVGVLRERTASGVKDVNNRASGAVRSQQKLFRFVSFISANTLVTQLMRRRSQPRLSASRDHLLARLERNEGIARMQTAARKAIVASPD
jgi:hypothetical protein